MSSYTFDNNKVCHYGDPCLEASTSLKSKYGRPQIFEDILNQGGEFIDPEFPHNEESVGSVDKLLDTAKPQGAQVVAQWYQYGWNGSATWYRVKDIAAKKYAGYNVVYNSGDLGKVCGRMAIQQGLVGDCYFVCSVAVVAMDPLLIRMPLPSDNSLNDVGVYHFRFWYQGSWVDVVVDDYLPCFEINAQNIYIVGSNFCVCEETKTVEFWPMLIEKAYAKLNGSYEVIAGGQAFIALEHLTSGYGECMITSNPDDVKNLYEQIKTLLNKRTLVCAGTSTGGNGIAGGHAYSVTGAHTISYNDPWGGATDVQLLRMRNPWGKTEWKGDWSDNSPKWQGVSESTKDEIGYVNKDEGEFWISYCDALVYFYGIHCCTYFYQVDTLKLKFFQTISKWDSSQGNTQSPVNMPTFKITVNNTEGDKGAIFVALTLLRQRKDKTSNDTFLTRVYETQGAETFDSCFYNTHQEHLVHGKKGLTALPYQSYSLGYEVPNGEYVVAAQRLFSGYETRFLIRIVSQHN